MKTTCRHIMYYLTKFAFFVVLLLAQWQVYNRLIRTSISLLFSRTWADQTKESFELSSNFADWPILKKLSPLFASRIDRFAKFNDRIYFITKNDRVFAYGSQLPNENLWGLNDKKPGRNLNKPTEIKELRGKKIIKCDSGKLHMMCMSNKKVWTWGENAYGQLGTNDTKPRYKPFLVPIIQEIISISTMPFTNFVVLKNGEVYSWGDNHENQAGVYGNKLNTLLTPTKVSTGNHRYDRVVSSFSNLTTLTHTNNNYYLSNEAVFISSSSLKTIHTAEVVSLTSTFSLPYFLIDQQIYVREEQGLKPFGLAQIKFDAIYGDKASEPNYLIAHSIDGQIYSWSNTKAMPDQAKLLSATNVPQAFALDHNYGFLPFMVKLKGAPQPPNKTTTKRFITTTTAPRFIPIQKRYSYNIILEGLLQTSKTVNLFDPHRSCPPKQWQGRCR